MKPHDEPHAADTHDPNPHGPDDAPYAGITVADLSQGLAGPYCAMQLAAYGAAVIKVEPLAGDWCRPLGTAREDMSAAFAAVNQGKRSIAVDFRAAAGREVALRIAAASDVVVESFRPGVADSLGLGYEQVCAARPEGAPGVVYVSVSGYGQTGPYRDLPATDTILQGLSGMAANNADGAGTPHKVYLTPIDYAAGQYAAHAAAAALFQRLRTGQGRHVDISLLATAAAMQGTRLAEAALTGGNPPRELFSPVGIFEAADGHIVVSTVKERHFASLCESLGAPELAADPRFAAHEARMANLDALTAALNARFRTATAGHWAATLTGGGMMCAPVQRYLDFLAGPELAATGLVGAAPQAPLGDVPVPRIPGGARRLPPAPRLGEHTAAILDSLGMDGAAVQELAQSGAVAGAAVRT